MDLKNFYNNYIKPYIWEGYLKIDGGWLPGDIVTEICRDLQSQGILVSVEQDSVVLDPKTNKDIGELDELDAILGLDTQKTIQQDYRYKFSFPGEHFKGLIKFTMAPALKGKTLDFELYSYDLNLDQQIFKLIVSKEDGNLVFKLVKGKLIPSFDLPIPLEGFIYNGKN